MIEQYPPGPRRGQIRRKVGRLLQHRSRSGGEERAHKQKHIRSRNSFYPPVLCWFEKNGKMPHENYTNHLQLMTRLNDRIIRMNQRIFIEQGAIYAEENDGMTAGYFSRAPKFHTFGVRNKKHRMEWYRERNPSEKLHLTDRHRSTNLPSAEQQAHTSKKCLNQSLHESSF
jgi:hypothetical protein